jgi:hypothetical protein
MDMHPADQYEASAKLRAEEIAARFGVTAAAVKQRPKLGAVRSKLMTLLSEGRHNPRSAVGLRNKRVSTAAGASLA